MDYSEYPPNHTSSHNHGWITCLFFGLVLLFCGGGYWYLAATTPPPPPTHVLTAADLCIDLEDYPTTENIIVEQASLAFQDNWRIALITCPSGSPQDYLPLITRFTPDFKTGDEYTFFGNLEFIETDLGSGYVLKVWDMARTGHQDSTNPDLEEAMWHPQDAKQYQNQNWFIIIFHPQSPMYSYTHIVQHNVYHSDTYYDPYLPGNEFP